MDSDKINVQTLFGSDGDMSRAGTSRDGENRSGQASGGGGVSPTDEPAYDTEAVDVVRFNVPAYTGKLRPWFTRLEAQFRAGKLKSAKVKFNVVIAQAPEHIVEQLTEEEIERISEKRDCYEQLKALLLRRFTPSEDERYATLFRAPAGPSNERPSDIYRKIQAEGKGLLPPESLKKIWLLRLPKLIQMLLVHDDNLPISELTERADAYHLKDQTHQEPSVEEIRTYNATNPFAPPAQISSTPLSQADQFGALAKALETLTAEVASLKFSSRSRSKQRVRSNRSSSRPRSSTPRPGKALCWYHHKFGDRATQCRPPCQYNSGN